MESAVNVLFILQEKEWGRDLVLFEKVCKFSDNTMIAGRGGFQKGYEIWVAC